MPVRTESASALNTNSIATGVKLKSIQNLKINNQRKDHTAPSFTLNSSVRLATEQQTSILSQSALRSLVFYSSY